MAKASADSLVGVCDTMDTGIRDRFFRMWGKHFGDQELPITFEMRDGNTVVTNTPVPAEQGCLIGQLNAVRRGETRVFDETTFPCEMGKFFLGGYPTPLVSEFVAQYLTCGIPGKTNGLRNRSAPELVRQGLALTAPLPLKGKKLVFKRWDKLTEDDTPDVVIFYARPEALSGLLMLANFDQVDPNAVICPCITGCSAIIKVPWMEQQKENPKSVLGMFDISARPFVATDKLTMAIPMKKMVKIIGYAEESFLVTGKWEVHKKRINRSVPAFVEECL